MPSADQLSRYLSLRQMRILLAVAEQGGVVRAAQMLHVAQPGISRALAELESGLRVKLFDRTPHGMSMTVFGEALLRRVRTIFAELHDAGEELKSLQDGAYGHMTIGLTPLLAAGALPRLLSALLVQRPGFALSVVEGSADFLLAELRARNIDIVLGRTPPPAKRAGDLDYQHLYDEKLLLVSGPGNPLARRQRITLRDTLDQDWALPPPGSMLHRVIEETFSRRNLPLPAARAQASSPYLVLELVVAAKMVTLLPGSILANRQGRPAVAVLMQAAPMPYGAVGCMTLRAKQLTPATAEFVSILRAGLPGILAGKRAAAAPAS